MAVSFIRSESLTTAAFAREALLYDPDTGKLTWRNRPRHHFTSDRVWRRWNTRFAGREAGGLHEGYRTLTLDSIRYFSHRICWLVHFGVWPENVLDHRNDVKSDNRLVNLREATFSQNIHSRPVYKNNRLGVKGVSVVPRGKSYQARIQKHGKLVRIGTFATIEEAQLAYDAAAQDWFGELARKSDGQA